MLHAVVTDVVCLRHCVHEAFPWWVLAAVCPTGLCVHLPPSTQSLWDILATIVHLGNVTFKENSKGHAEFGSSEQLECIAKVCTVVCVCMHLMFCSQY